MVTTVINQFVYRPDATSSPKGLTPADLSLEYEEVAVTAADKVRLSGWYLPAARPRHIMLYCHGNAGDIRDWVYAAPPFLEAGISLLIWDYRGYGSSQGKPSEEGLYLDGEAMWRWLRERSEKEGLPASILGKSLGSAVAIHAALDDPPYRLILDSALASMREVVAGVAAWIPKAAIPNMFESLAKAPALACPTLLLHGGRDSLVPLHHGQRLHQAITAPKKLHVIEPAEHNNISMYPEYYQHITAFLGNQGEVNPQDQTDDTIS